VSGYIRFTDEPATRHRADAVAMRPRAVALPLVGTLTCLLVSTPPAYAEVVRCESADGKVTYANVACPEGSRSVRTLPPAKPPAPGDAKAAQQRQKAQQQQLQKLEQQRQAEVAVRERERAAEAKAQARQKDKRDLACRKLSRQVSDAEDELARAALNRREEIELRLQRLRSQYSAECSG
jgi:hypothetical protein